MKTLSQRLRSARQQSDYVQDPPSDSTDYFDHLRSIVRKAAKNGCLELLIVLYARISDPRPGKRETTGDQLGASKAAISSLEQKFGIKIKVVGYKFAESVSGWKFKKSDRPKLVKAVKVAKENDAVLVAYDVSRFVRNKECQHQVEPTVDDFKQFMRLVGKVKLATIANPKIHEDRSRSTKRGHQVNKAKPGRPKKRTYKKPYTQMPIKHARVIRLRDSGMSWEKVAKAVGKPKSTVRGWYAKGKASQK